jgi:shikimate kinase
MASLLFICGMPGSGKSSFGKRLANKLAWSFLDLDELITRVSGNAPQQIILNSGETDFRQIEAEILRTTSSLSNHVIACGGGTPCFNDNLTWMKKQGVVAYLDLPLKTIHQRILQSEGFKKRPLLGDSPELVFENLSKTWDGREFYYSQIDWKINGLDLKLPAIMEEFQKQLAAFNEASH